MINESTRGNSGISRVEFRGDSGRGSGGRTRAKFGFCYVISCRFARLHALVHRVPSFFFPVRRPSPVPRGPEFASVESGQTRPGYRRSPVIHPGWLEKSRRRVLSGPLQTQREEGKTRLTWDVDPGSVPASVALCYRFDQGATFQGRWVHFFHEIRNRNTSDPLVASGIPVHFPLSTGYPGPLKATSKHVPGLLRSQCTHVPHACQGGI